MTGPDTDIATLRRIAQREEDEPGYGYITVTLDERNALDRVEAEITRLREGLRNISIGAKPAGPTSIRDYARGLLAEDTHRSDGAP